MRLFSPYFCKQETHNPNIENFTQSNLCKTKFKNQPSKLGLCIHTCTSVVPNLFGIQAGSLMMGPSTGLIFIHGLRNVLVGLDVAMQGWALAKLLLCGCIGPRYHHRA